MRRKSSFIQSSFRRRNKFKALSVSTNNAGMPCGACRQVIWDICGNIPVLICDDSSLITKTESIKLLPMPLMLQNYHNAKLPNWN